MCNASVARSVASKAIKGSETGLCSLRAPPSIPRSNSRPPTAAKDTHNSSIQASVGSLSLSLVIYLMLRPT
jgi:hypothetical protein